MSFPLLVAQFLLLDLAGRGLGQLRDLDGTWAHVASETLLGEVQDFFLGGILAVGELDERLGSLAPLLIGGRRDGDCCDGGMFGDGLLNFDCRNVLAAGDDDVLLPVT